MEETRRATEIRAAQRGYRLEIVQSLLAQFLTLSKLAPALYDAQMAAVVVTLEAEEERLLREQREDR